MNTVALIAILATASAQSASLDGGFDNRVRNAQRIEATEDGAAYLENMWSRIGKHVQTSMHRCFPPEKKADATTFVLVGDVAQQNRLTEARVRPDTPMTRCFATAMTDVPYPPPPDAFLENGVPIAIEMRVTP